jgi:hypothetical protein
MLVKGIVFGLLAAAVNFALFYLGMRWVLRSKSGAVGILAPLVTGLRYVVFAAIIYLFLKLGLGEVWGLLIGVTVGIAAYMIWQAFYARTRRSDKVQP